MATIEISEHCSDCPQRDSDSCYGWCKQGWHQPVKGFPRQCEPDPEECPGPGTYDLIRSDKLTPEAVREWATQEYIPQNMQEAAATFVLDFLKHARGK